MDLIDPWWPESDRAAMAARVREAAGRRGIAIHSVQIGLAGYTYNGLLHPDETARRIAEEWWRRSIDLAAELGAARGGRPDRRAERRRCGLARAPQGPVCGGRRPARRPRRSREAVGSRGAPRRADAAPARDPVDDRRGEAACGRHLGRRRAAVVRDRRRPRAVPAALRGGRLAVPWLTELRDHIGVLHLQNHDYRADAHWGWPDARGSYDPAGFHREVSEAGLDHLPVFIEVFSPFEQADDEIVPLIQSSLAACRP